MGFSRTIVVVVFLLGFGCSRSEGPPSDAEIHQTTGDVLRATVGKSLKGFRILDLQRAEPRKAIVNEIGKTVLIYPIKMRADMELVDGSPLKEMADKDKTILERERRPQEYFFYRIGDKWKYTMHPDIDLKWETKPTAPTFPAEPKHEA